MRKKSAEMDLQHDFKDKNNKPGSKSINSEDGRAIKEAKQIVKTRN